MGTVAGEPDFKLGEECYFYAEGTKTAGKVKRRIIWKVRVTSIQFDIQDDKILYDVQNIYTGKEHSGIAKKLLHKKYEDALNIFRKG